VVAPVTRRPPGHGDQDGEFARADALAGLAREVDGLRRGLDPLAGVPTRVDDLARTVAQLADALSAAPPRPGPTPAPSWLAAAADRDATRALLEALCEWLRRVFLRYPDGAAVLPECWLFHPDVVEELLWLQHAWLAAYEAKGPSVQLAGDWHDRQRPGVVRRLKAAVGSCSKERHQTRAGWGDGPRGAAAVPGTDALPTIAGWWATNRDDPAPEPARDLDDDRVPGFGARLDGDRGATAGRYR
jgi:hypothetical protein